MTTVAPADALAIHAVLDDLQAGHFSPRDAERLRQLLKPYYHTARHMMYDQLVWAAKVLTNPRPTRLRSSA